MAVVNAVAVSVGHHAPTLGRALRLVESQDGDLGEFGAGATAAVRAAPAQDFLALVLKQSVSEVSQMPHGLRRFSDKRKFIPQASLELYDLAFDTKSKSKGKQCFDPL